MTSFALKVLAYSTMFVDHIGLLFFPEEDLFRIIGRISFPLFAFLIAEGFLKTRDESSYLKRLILFGFIAQIPYMYFIFTAGGDVSRLNILFTLAAGLSLLILIKKKAYFLLTFVSVIFIFINEIIRFDYGLYGIILILCSYLFIKYRSIGYVFLLYATILVSLNIESLAQSRLQLYALVSIIPLMFYNGEMGKRVSRWWFYAIYPVHFLILVGLYYIL